MKRWQKQVCAFLLLGYGVMGVSVAEAGTFQLGWKAAAWVGKRLMPRSADDGSAWAQKPVQESRLGRELSDSAGSPGRRILSSGDEALSGTRYSSEAKAIVGRFGEPAEILLARHGKAIVELSRRYGREAVDVCLKHPGLGKRLVEDLGATGVTLGKRLQTKELIQFYRMCGKKAGSSTKHGLARRVLSQGKKALKTAERHPKSVLGGSALAYLLTHPGQLGNLTSQTLKGTLKGIGVDPAEAPLKSAGVVGMLILILTGPVYFYGYLRHRRRKR